MSIVGTKVVDWWIEADAGSGLHEHQSHVTIASVLLWLPLAAALRHRGLWAALLVGGLATPIWGACLVQWLTFQPFVGLVVFVLLPLLAPIGAITGLLVWWGVRRREREAGGQDEVPS